MAVQPTDAAASVSLYAVDVDDRKPLMRDNKTSLVNCFPSLASPSKPPLAPPHRRRWSRRRLLAVVLAAFLLGYYVQVIAFFLHIRTGVSTALLSLPEDLSLRSQQILHALQDQTKRVLFVCSKTNWDYIGMVASPHTVLFAHESVEIPKPLEEALAVVRHSGVDSYLNLHNKTVTIMSHVHRKGEDHHLFKQDDEAVIFWPHVYQCLHQCKRLGSCYAGDMHVNIGDATNSNSYVFATGGSYFVGNELLQCMLDQPVYVRVDGLDHGEDKTIGKMLHFNKCDVQYVSCKWFNNKEVYSPQAMVRMTKRTTNRFITETSALQSQEEQQREAKVHGEEVKP